jgi:hypothetical protein
MRRGSSTVVVLVGVPGPGLLEALGGSANVAISGGIGGGLERAISALEKASGTSSPYVVVGADPLGEVALEWRDLWNAGDRRHEFERVVGEALSAWRSGRFELPDYYVVVLSPNGRGDALVHHQDFHLGLLRSHRPARVLPVLSPEEQSEEAALVLSVLSNLPQGPWWPPLDRLVNAAESFFPGDLTVPRHGNG